MAVCEQKDWASAPGRLMDGAKQRGFAGKDAVFAGEVALATLSI
jgi:hypothetical protein